MIKLNANHSDMCRFDPKSNKQDQESYRLVQKRLLNMYSKAIGDYSIRPQQAPAKSSDGRLALALPSIPSTNESAFAFLTNPPVSPGAEEAGRARDMATSR